MIDTSHIYVISNASHPGWYKVGFTADPDRRLRTFQPGDPTRQFKMEFITPKIVEPMNLEKQVHQHFKAQNEWIEAPLDEIIGFIQTLLVNEEPWRHYFNSPQ